MRRKIGCLDQSEAQAGLMVKKHAQVSSDCLPPVLVGQLVERLLAVSGPNMMMGFVRVGSADNEEAQTQGPAPTLARVIAGATEQRRPFRLAW